VIPAHDNSGQLVLSAKVRESKCGFIFPIALNAETGVLWGRSTPIMVQPQRHADGLGEVIISEGLNGIVASFG
jgi:hypothetical protein